MKQIAALLLTCLALAGCNSFNPTSRTLPLAENVVPLPVLCEKAKLSDDPRVVALSNKYCAVQNQQRLVSAKVAYEKIRACYNTGRCND